MGTTRYNPAFIVTNFLRDATGASVNSESWVPPIAQSIKGLIIRYSQNPEMRQLMNEMKEEGVFYSGITEIKGNSPQALATTIKEAFKEGGMTDSVKQKIKTLAEWVGSINESVELAPKLHEYYFLRSQGVPKQEAAMRAREVNIDFQRAGSVGREYNKAVAFFNANIQGLDKSARVFRANPGATMAKILLYSGLPSLLAWWVGNMGDDEERKEYEGINKQMKDMYWHFKMGDTWVRLPKPQEYGLFGSLLERALDATYKEDSAAFRGYDGSIIEALLPPLLPNIATTAVETITNHNFFTGRPIVSRKYESLPSSLQYGPETSGIAKTIGEWTDISPFKIDHVIRSMGGTIGREATKLPDRLIGNRNREKERWSEKPFVRSFTTDPYRNNEFIDRFYEVADRTEKAKNGYKQQGRGTRPDKDVKFAEMFSKARKALSDINKARAKIRNASNLTPQQKRARVDDLDKKAVQLARRILERYDR
jgi:hypothetical protein